MPEMPRNVAIEALRAFLGLSEAKQGRAASCGRSLKVPFPEFSYGLVRCPQAIVKRIKRSPERFEVLDLFARLSREQGLDIAKESAPADFARLLGTAIRSLRGNEIAIHGRRIQEMFSFVAASLGKTALVKGEDAGDIITSEDDLLAPDYRLILVDKTQFLVEVKNNHTADPKSPLRLSPQYIDRLKRYGDLMALRVFVGVYWSRWNLWTLTPVDEIPPDGLTLLSGSLRNHMSLLGDQVIGTTPPLVLRIVADPTMPRKRDSDGLCKIRIGAVEFLCAGTQITDSVERTLAFQFILFGDWPEADTDVQLDGDDVIHFDMIFAPEETAPDQNFQVIGHLSSMISRRFQLITTKGRTITALSPSAEPGSLGVAIPEDYRGTAFPLWRLVVSPSRGGA